MTELLDLTPCPGCGISSSGISAGCADCARGHPDRYAAWAQSMSNELGQLRPVVLMARRWRQTVDDISANVRDAENALIDAVDALMEAA